MKFFRCYNSYLRFQVKSILRKNHPDLFQPFLSKTYFNFKQYTFSRSRWWFILLAVILVFSIAGIINIDFLNIIEVDSLTAKILVDQRTGNIAAVTAITLVVVGFLINNLAVKESFAYRLLFKHSYLYPIIYLTLSTIGCFFVASTLRDTIEPRRFVNIVLAGTYLSLIILFLIGFLFKTIINFTNDKTIRQLLHNELMIEAKHNIKVALISKYSGKIYQHYIEKFGAEKYSWANTLNFLNSSEGFKELTDEELEAINNKEKRIYDIKLTGLRKFILKKKKISEKIFYQDLALEKTVTKYDNYLWQKDKPNTDKEKSQLKKYIILKKVKEIKQDKEPVRKYFDQKLESLANNSEHRNLESLLDSYYELYKLQMKHNNEIIP